MPANATPLLRSGRVAAAAIPAYAPVRADGYPAANGDEALGIAEASAAAGTRVSLVVDGSAEAWAGAAIADGQALQVGDNNTVIPLASGKLIGRALNAASVGDKVEVLLSGSYAAAGGNQSVTIDPTTGQVSTASAAALAASGLVPSSCGAGIVVTSWSQVQAAHDALKLLGGGDISFSPTGTFVVPDGGGVTIDTSFVGIKFNKAKIDASAMTTGAVITLYGSMELHTFTSSYGKQFNREYTDLLLVGSSDLENAPHDNTPRAIGVLWDAPNGGGGTLKYSNRSQMINPVIMGFWKGMAIKDGSYMTRVKSGHITRNYYGAYMQTGAADFAEIFGFEDTVFAENGIHLNDTQTSGNQWRFNNCHFDYHFERILEIKGSHVIADGCHFEWSYGKAAGDTLCPFKFTSASGALYIKGGKIAYLDSTNAYQPYYAGVFDMSDNSQVLEITDTVFAGLGRRTETTSFDSLVYVSATSVIPQVKIKAHATGVTLNDLPAMTMVSDYAGFCVGGILRNAETPLNELGWRTSVTGTAAISSVTADENGVTRKNGQSMLKITGAGKVTIAFPLFEPTRRHAWSFFTATSTATSVFAGSVTIKERQGGFAPKFDGSTVTWVADSRGAQYGATTVTINTASATWVRRSWKNCTDRPVPRLPMNVASCVLVEIDTTGMTAGALYVSHPAFDLM